MEERLIILKEYLLNHEALNDKFSTYSRLYKMTTENIKEFIDTIDCKDKNVLTVVGSGDHALNTILNGARNITCFDVNPFSIYHFNLKKEAIKLLTYKEFSDFFDVSSTSDAYYTFLDKELYLSLKSNLDSETKQFFDTLYSVYKDDCFDILKRVYYDFKCPVSHLSNMCNYIDPDKYLELSNILRNEDINISFIHSDFQTLSEKLGNNMFDIILLSNICDYTEWMYEDNCLQNYKNDLIKITNNLNNNGIIQLGYVYTHPYIGAHISLFAKREEREKVFDKDKLTEIEITSYNDQEPYQYVDKVYVYKKD